jgi:putative tryptophan/tyrosine transport system substrate-binding protein
MKMQRREFITLLGGATAAWPLVARAQQDGRVRRVGVLVALTEDDPEQTARLAAFRGSLARLGWLEGRNLSIDTRFAGGMANQYSAIAKELVALQPDVIVVQTTQITAALRRETTTIPIVFTNVADPVSAGFAATLARPGGNLTGLLLFEASITGKWLAMLKEIAPSLSRVAIMGNPKTIPFNCYLEAASASGPALAIETLSAPVESDADIERAMESFARTLNTGLLVLPDVTNTLHRDRIVALAASRRVPAVYTARFFVTAGGLMSYETDRVDMYRQAAAYVSRILRGDKPADLPVQAPVKYETVLNLKTAKALGLTVPDLMLVRADEVIE